MNRLKWLLPIVALAVLAAAARSPLAPASMAGPQQVQCPDKAPVQSSETKWGDSVSCGEQHCGQNYSIDYEYTCGADAQGQKCVSGQVVVTYVVEYKGVPECEPDADAIRGPGLIAQPCLTEPPPGG